MENNKNNFHKYIEEILAIIKLMQLTVTDMYVLLEKKVLKEKQQALPALEDRKRWTKQDVLDNMNMSESKYKRNLDSGVLRPMRLNGIDEYFEEDLLNALEESRRRGRI